MRISLVDDALKAAAGTRGGLARGLAGAVFHSDHGSVYTSKDYARLCAELGVTQSMGAVGSSADNALAESFNATLKREVLQDAACWADEDTCRRQVFRWILRYNTRRRHSWCRYHSPSTYESLYAATLPSAA
jgi:transposase InsO family protein